MISRRTTFALLALFFLSACGMTPYSKEIHEKSTATLQEIINTADQRITSEPAPTAIIYAGFALSAEAKAFHGDIHAGAKIANRINKNNVKLLLSNSQEISSAYLPFATEDDILLGLNGTAQLAEKVMQRNKRPPLLIVLLSSHGHNGFMSVNADGRISRQLYSGTLEKWLKPLEPYPTLLIISSCHSGSLIPSLQRDNRIILTSADADKNSFGCGVNDKMTWYVNSLERTLSPKMTLKTWHEKSVELVEKWEKNGKYLASQPQLWIGKNMTQIAETPLARMTDAPMFAPPTSTIAQQPAGTPASLQ